MKDYILKYSPETDAYESLEGLSELESREIGKELGAWLKFFSQWSEGNIELKDLAAKNIEAKNVRHMLNFSWLANRVEEYPHQLYEVKDILKDVEQAMAAEGQDETQLRCIHGDFWTGKYVTVIRRGE